MIRRVYRLADGSQILVETSRNGDEIHQTIATRPSVGDRWSPPLMAEYADDDATGEWGLAHP